MINDGSKMRGIARDARLMQDDYLHGFRRSQRAYKRLFRRFGLLRDCIPDRLFDHSLLDVMEQDFKSIRNDIDRCISLLKS